MTATITGADNGVDPNALLDLQWEFPFAEWGVLLSENRLGTERYPDKAWLRRLAEVSLSSNRPLNLSAHFCGEWMRNVIRGREDDARKIIYANSHPLFRRVQFNCHKEYPAATPAFASALKRLASGAAKAPASYILPWDGKESSMVDYVWGKGILADPLFDLSGGSGELASDWPTADGHTGYAGGLSPDNLPEQLERIGKAAGPYPFWIDVESGVRTDNKFDLAKVRRFLEIARPFAVSR